MPTPNPTPSGPWPRWRLLATLTGLTLTALALLGGLGVAVRDAFHPDALPGAAASGRPANEAAGRVRGDAYRDQVAAAPMLRVSPADAYTPGVAADTGDPIRVPGGVRTGPAGVATGYPRTPEGALGQLAAIEVRVVEAMSIPTTREVHDAWVLDGGPAFADWELTRGVQSFLTSARLPERDESILIAATPAAGLVKATDGPDWVLACVLLDVSASITRDARVGYGHCARMQWHHDRWQIGPGTPPSPAPSVWPGSDVAVAAGWRPWTTASGGGR